MITDREAIKYAKRLDEYFHAKCKAYSGDCKKCPMIKVPTACYDTARRDLTVMIPAMEAINEKG